MPKPASARCTNCQCSAMYTPIARNGSLPSAKARKNGWFFVCQRSRIARTSSTTLGAVELTGVVMGSSSSRPGCPVAGESCPERGAEVPREFRQERVGLLPDDGLTELPDLAEHGEVGVDLHARTDLDRHQREMEAGADPSTQPPVVRLGAHSRSPSAPVRLLHDDRALE